MLKTFLLYLFLFFSALLFGECSLYAQDTLPAAPRDTMDYYEMSLEQLLRIKAHGIPSELESLINSLIQAASKKPMSVREAPNIITLITEEEIKNSGARDFIDVLRLVPGFDFGVDVEGVVGIGSRGNWAHEGKILLLIDGQEMNELLFGTTQFGNHYPVAQIKKIEVIRGPGSAVYGGAAELGVINVITKKGGEIGGAGIEATYGHMGDTYGRRNMDLFFGAKTGEVEYAFSLLNGQGQRSDRTFADFYGASYPMTGNASLSPTFFNASLSYKGLSFQGIFDRYHTTVRDAYNHVANITYPEKFNGYFTELKYDRKLNKKLTLIPRFAFRRNVPWSTPDTTEAPEYLKSADQYKAALTSLYDFNRKINLVTGGEFFVNKATDKTAGGVFYNGKNILMNSNLAFFTQGLLRTRMVNIILGVRYDFHSQYGPAFVPRLGLTKKMGRFHFKGLYSEAYRSPSIENINLSLFSIKPEKTKVVELETGFQLTRKSLLTLNVYKVKTTDPIIYYYNDFTLEDAYTNGDKTGSKGIEADYRIKNNWGYLNVNYAWYTVKNMDKVPYFSSTLNPAVLLAFPSHKINVNASFRIGEHFSVNPSFSYGSRRYGYTAADSAGDPVESALDPYALFNINLMFNDLFVRGLSCSAGVFDLCNRQVDFIQPYNGGHAPLPGPSREFVFRIRYEFRYDQRRQ